MGIHFTGLKYTTVYQRQTCSDSKPYSKGFLLRFSRLIFLEKKQLDLSFTDHANLPPIFILIMEVALRIDRKCQKGIYTHVIRPRFNMLFIPQP